MYKLIVLLCLCSTVFGQRKMEHLDRGIVVVRNQPDSIFISWRLLTTDPNGVAFNIYCNDQLQNRLPVKSSTCYTAPLRDTGIDTRWRIVPVVKGKEQLSTDVFLLHAHTAVQQYLSIALQPPPGQYSANDATVGDLDGDGRYEIILKWDPVNAKNPPQTGITDNQLIDAYTMEGKLLWRIDLGRNIRSGAAYTQLLVYDLDGDGKSELVCKTADGTIDGTGTAIGDKDKDWRCLVDAHDGRYGKILDGPEYITVFNGLTGAVVRTATFIPDRYPLDGWGGIGGNGGNDNTGGRADRYTAGIAYLDGIHPSVVFVRGWYGRSVVAAWDFQHGQLGSRWVFDTHDSSNPYSGMGNHSLSIADVDGDGKDEICIGAMTVDDDGKGLYTTGLRHGDALHLTDMDPDRPGMEVFGIHENEDRTVALQTPGVAMFDAATGEILWSLGPGEDVGRGVAADIDPTHAGFENWGGPGGLRDVHGKTISTKTPASTNFVTWWDGDLLRELLDRNRIDKWDYKHDTTINLLTATGCVANNGTKATPCLSADLFGDWREEVIWRTADNSTLRIYTTTIPTAYRFITWMQDPQYRLAVAWQNVSYNQPPHPGFYFGEKQKANGKR